MNIYYSMVKKDILIQINRIHHNAIGYLSLPFLSLIYLWIINDRLIVSPLADPQSIDAAIKIMLLSPFILSIPFMSIPIIDIVFHEKEQGLVSLNFLLLDRSFKWIRGKSLFGLIASLVNICANIAIFIIGAATFNTSIINYIVAIPVYYYIVTLFTLLFYFYTTGLFITTMSLANNSLTTARQSLLPMLIVNMLIFAACFHVVNISSIFIVLFAIGVAGCVIAFLSHFIFKSLNMKIIASDY